MQPIPWDSIINERVLPFGVGALAITGGIVMVLVLSYLRHRERMAMIRQGIHPDQPGLAKKPDEKSTASKAVPSKDPAWNDWTPKKIG